MVCVSDINDEQETGMCDESSFKWNLPAHAAAGVTITRAGSGSEMLSGFNLFLWGLWGGGGGGGGG